MAKAWFDIVDKIASQPNPNLRFLASQGLHRIYSFEGACPKRPCIIRPKVGPLASAPGRTEIDGKAVTVQPRK